MRTKEEWAKLLDLSPHPEGGYYTETYRSDEFIDVTIAGHNSLQSRNLSTAIYFLIEQNNFSAFHRIQSDEMWHFYSGDALLIHMIDEDGNYSTQRIGDNPESGDAFQFVVKAGIWFASEVVKGGEYSLVGCTVSFGFDFKDFELANQSLIDKYPDHKEIIARLIR